MSTDQVGSKLVGEGYLISKGISYS
jgi:hypothetical protein